ncbi:MAG TPA: adenosylmethionine decarboxylase [Candidatus Marinimicrobia bacterium]|nr:adenosylmethionine decarboxylase [Candidatus Neomarinimicrobiota bacterium]
MEREIKGYGPHLMLDLNNCDPEILNDLNACYQLLNDIPEKIGMTKITRPYVFRYEGSYENDDGITGVVIIAESHISLHTYPKKNFVFVDLFSCKPFDVEEAKNYIIEYFKSKSPKVHLQIRGEEFPDAVAIKP